MAEEQFDLIVVIVPAGKAEDVLEAARSAGAEGATVVHGRGTGIHEQKKIFNIPIEPEKEIIMLVVPQQRTDGILAAIDEAVDLSKPGHGIGFVLEAKRVVGLVHLMSGMTDG